MILNIKSTVLSLPNYDTQIRLFMIYEIGQTQPEDLSTLFKATTREALPY